MSLERIEQVEIYNLLTSEARVISESSSMLAAALQSFILLVFAVIYMAWLSLAAFVICLTLIGIGMWMYSRRLQEVGLEDKIQVMMTVLFINGSRRKSHDVSGRCGGQRLLRL